GLPMEAYERCRQAGEFYFVDCTNEESEWRTGDAAGDGEMWGGLYAHGHIEVDDYSRISVSGIIEIARDAAKSSTSDVIVSQNKAKRKEVAIYGRGLRLVVDTQAPVFC